MLKIARGPRAAEQLLLDELAELLPGGCAADLSAPVLVLVPSGTMRRRLLARVTERIGPGLLGLEITSLRALAQRLLARAGRLPGGGGEFFEILVRREAEREEILSRELGAFDDGLGLCVQTASDLASAGLEAADESELAAALERCGTGRRRQRAEALVAATRRALAAMGELGLERSGDLMARAAALLEETPDLLDAGALIVQGFADAPGQTRAFLRALMRQPMSSFILDLPADPQKSTDEAAAARFARSFATSIGLEVPADQVDGVGLPAQLQAFDAAGVEAELREISWRIEADLERGIAPEAIAVVCRDLPRRAPVIRRLFAKAGIPCSGPDLDRGLHPGGDAAAALLRLLRQGPRLDLRRFAMLWGDALFGDAGPGRRGALELGLRSLGAADLRAVAGLDPERACGGRDQLALPVRTGVVENDEDDPGRSRAARLDRRLLASAQEAAAALVSGLGQLDTALSVQERAAALAQLLRRALGHDDENPPPWLAVLDELATTAVGDLPLEANEFALIFQRAIDAKLKIALGGRGRGVQVLGVAQARGIAFDRLYLCGVNARVFPAPGREDPLLDDEVRSALRDELPGLGLAADRADEEGYLFAQLMDAAPQVTVSWLRSDDDGKPLARSPFVERLMILDDEGKSELDEPRSIPTAPADRLREALASGRRLDVEETSLFLALEGRHAELARTEATRLELVRAALPESLREAAPPGDQVAGGLDDLLAEIEAGPFDEDGQERLARLSPWSGEVGPDRIMAEGPLWITAIEGVARCPWQTFLSRALRVEELADPVGTLPEIDNALLGQVVHESLSLLLPGDGAGNPPPRPDEAAIEASLRRAAAALGREAGIVLPGLVEGLARRARPYVETALDFEYRGGEGPPVIESEAQRTLVFERSDGEKRELLFRADRIDAAESGEKLTDYKTGRPPSTGVKEETRRKHLLARIAEGTLLQGAAYARRGGVGRYLFLHPNLDEEHRELAIRDDDEEMLTRFDASLTTLEEAWSKGLLPPRLLRANGDANTACEYCEFRRACTQGDSGAKRRLVDLVRTRGELPEPDLLARVWDPAGVGIRDEEEGE